MDQEMTGAGPGKDNGSVGKCVSWLGSCFGALRNTPSWISILIVFALVRGALWSVLIPPFQAPDEQVHFSGVYDFYINNSNPWSPDRAFDQRTQEFAEYAQFEEQRFRPLDRREFKFESTNGPNEEKIADLPRNMGPKWKPNPIVGHPPFYYMIGSLGLRLSPSTQPIYQLLAARMASVVLGAVGIIFAFLAARELFPTDERWQSYIVFFVAFFPMATFLTSIVNADAYAHAVMCFYFWALLRWILRREDPQSLYWLVLSLVLVITTKKNFYFAFPFTPLVLLALMVYERRIRWREIAFLVPPFIVFVIFYVTYPGYEAYSILKELRSVPVEAKPWSDIHLFDFAKQLLWDNLDNYWGEFGWCDARYPESIYTCIRIVLYAGIIMSLVALFLPSRTELRKRGLLACWGFTFMIFLAVLGANVYYYRTTGRTYPLGRYLLPAALPHSVCVLVGATAFLHARRAHLVAQVMCLFMIIMNLYGLFLVIVPRYDL
jgi:hypothetical protein